MMKTTMNIERLSVILGLGCAAAACSGTDILDFQTNQEAGSGGSGVDSSGGSPGRDASGGKTADDDSNETGHQGGAGARGDALLCRSNPEDPNELCENLLDGDFIQVATGDDHSCALRSDGTVVCWQVPDWYFVDWSIPAPRGEFVQIASGTWHGCGVRVDGQVECWGNDSNDWGALTPPAGEFVQVACGHEYSCGLRTDGALSCWGNVPNHQPEEIAGPFEQISTGMFECWTKGCSQGGRHTCGLDVEGNIQCWGEDGFNDLPSPTGTFSSVEASGDFACALDAEGQSVCWGPYEQPYPEGPFKQITRHPSGTCGLRPTGEVSCMDYKGDAEFVPDDVRFAQIDCGSECCGVTLEGGVWCWNY